MIHPNSNEMNEDNYYELRTTDGGDLHKTVTRASASCDPNEFSMRQTNIPSSLICTFSIFRLLSGKILDLQQQAFNIKTRQLFLKL